MNKANPIKFGTDGWRAVIAAEFTFDNVAICAQALADYLKGNGLATRGAVIGYDTRFGSEDFAVASAEVLAGNGIKVYLCPQPAPTPVVSYGIIAKRAGGGIVITASHNPGRYSGFKVKSADGASAPTEAIAEIETNIARIFPTGMVDRLPIAQARRQGLVEDYDIDSDYFRQVQGLLDLERIKRADLKVVADAMYGAGSGYFDNILAGGRIRVAGINQERNPLFPGIQPEPIAVNLHKLSLAVKRRRASVGLATDGDADRIGIVDEQGIFLTQLQVFTLLAVYLLEVRRERGAIVKTITAGSMLDRVGEIYQVPVFETKVGFKYVAPVMLQQNALIGGEESGGYGFRGHVPERDGILAGLYFLDYLVQTGKTPSQLLADLYRKVGPHYYHRVDLEFPTAHRQAIIERVSHQQPASIDGVKVAKLDTADGFRFTLTDNSWLLIRFSGTEPLLRIYAESSTVARVHRLLEIGKEFTKVGQ